MSLPLVSAPKCIFNYTKSLLFNHEKYSRFFQIVNQLSTNKFIKIVEVASRDGLQNEKKIVNTSDKITFIDKLSQSGLGYIETTSFVSPEWIPQLADSCEVIRGIQKFDNVTYSALVPNIKGLDKAIQCGLKEVAIFGAATDSFSKSNINCTIEESLKRFKPVLAQALSRKIRVRGYVSCVIKCPFEGYVNPSKVYEVVNAMLQLGCYEISLGDTIGAGVPEDWETLITYLTQQHQIPCDKLAIHCHDEPLATNGLQNIELALKLGIKTIDSSVAAIGGCPYADGKSRGNVATEDVVAMLHNLGYKTGVDLKKLLDAGNFISGVLGTKNLSRYATSFRQ